MTLSIPILALLTATLPPGEWRHAGTSLVSTYRYDYVINLWNYGPLYSVEGAEGVLDREQFIQGSLGGPDDWSPMFMPLQTEWGSRSWEYPTHDLPYCHRSTGEIRWVHESGLEKWTWYEGDIGAFTVERTRTWHETPATYVWGVFPIDNPE